MKYNAKFLTGVAVPPITSHAGVLQPAPPYKLGSDTTKTLGTGVLTGIGITLGILGTLIVLGLLGKLKK